MNFYQRKVHYSPIGIFIYFFRTILKKIYKCIPSSKDKCDSIETLKHETIKDYYRFNNLKKGIERD